MDSNAVQVMNLEELKTFLEKKVWVCDIEQFSNFHCATFLDRDNTDNVRAFVIYDDQDDSKAYYNFLKNEVSGLIGFNIINYDYPIIHFFMNLMEGYGLNRLSSQQLTGLLFEESNRIIKEQYTAIYEKDVRIPLLDLFKIHHFDNKAKITSLKEVEIAINFENVQDLPFEPDHYVLFDEVDEILGYNLNDVKATYEFYLLTKDGVDMRKKLSNRYRINLRNANDPKIGQEIFGHQIALKKRIPYKYLKELRTYRHSIKFWECILPYIKFNSIEFNTLLLKLQATEIESTYGTFDESVIYKGFKYDYGTGGIHGCIAPGIYKSENGYIIIDIDVKSYYPNLAIQNKIFPQHLGIEFVHIYEELFKQRLKAQAEGDKATNSGLKLALNGTFGKSNDKFSLFYDPKYFISITINGQLLLSMLAESFADNLNDLTILQVNTDGITVKIHENQRDKLNKLCENWQTITGLILEYKEYKQMVIRDVNNYLAIDSDDKPKYKGCFEIVPMQNGAVAYNKNWSMRVVPKALDAYYRYGTPVEDFIRNHDNIYDFCLSFRARAGWTIYRHYVVDRYEQVEKQQKTIRYYISTNGNTLTKQNQDRVIIQLESGYACTVFNKYEKKEMKDYNINYSYYITQANKIKNAVDDGQLKLF